MLSLICGSMSGGARGSPRGSSPRGSTTSGAGRPTASCIWATADHAREHLVAGQRAGVGELEPTPVGGPSPADFTSMARRMTAGRSSPPRAAAHLHADADGHSHCRGTSRHSYAARGAACGRLEQHARRGRGRGCSTAARRRGLRLFVVTRRGRLRVAAAGLAAEPPRGTRLVVAASARGATPPADTHQAPGAAATSEAMRRPCYA